jgi:hypothetical protein
MDKILHDSAVCVGILWFFESIITFDLPNKMDLK